MDDNSRQNKNPQQPTIASDTDIDAAASKIVNQDKITNTQSSVGSSNPTSQSDQSSVGVESTIISWINGPHAQSLFCWSSIFLVIIVGREYHLHYRSTDTHIAFWCAVGLSALIILYYGLVAKVIALWRRNTKVYTGNSAAIACLVLLAILCVVVFSVVGLFGFSISYRH